MNEDRETSMWTSAISMVLVVIVALMVTGCATKATTATEENLKAGLTLGAIDAAKAPLFELTCPAAGCVIGNLKIGNPQGGAQMAEMVRVVMTPQPSTSEKVALALIDKGFGALTFGLGANAVKSFASNMFGSQTAIATTGFGALQNTASAGFSVNGVIASRIPQPGAVTNTTTTTQTVSGAGVIGSGQVATTDRHDVTNTTTTTTSTTDRHDVVNPAPKVCIINSAGVQNCPGG